MSTHSTKSVAIIGARGYVGHELIKLVSAHPLTDLIAVSSRSAAGKLVSEQVAECKNKSLEFCDLQASDMRGIDADVVFLVLPNNISQDYIDVIHSVRPETIIIDLSFDHRLDTHANGDYPWVYGLSELNAPEISQSKRISNPGCYATAAQLGLYPLQELISGTPNLFGVSGYSGAGSTPNDKNNPDNLKNNLLPYALTGHLHESEISRHIGHPVNFMPHVASFFSGLSVTISCDVKNSISPNDLFELFSSAYKNHDLIKVQKHIPYPRDIAGHNGAIIGGFAIDERNGKNVRLVVVIDNLLKGAATQALQNMNLALGLDILLGIKN